MSYGTEGRIKWFDPFFDLYIYPLLPLISGTSSGRKGDLYCGHGRKILRVKTSMINKFYFILYLP